MTVLKNVFILVTLILIMILLEIDRVSCVSFQQRRHPLFEKGVWWTGPTTRGWRRAVSGSTVCALSEGAWPPGRGRPEIYLVFHHWAACWLCQPEERGILFRCHTGSRGWTKLAPAPDGLGLFCCGTLPLLCPWLYFVVPKALAFSYSDSEQLC